MPAYAWLSAAMPPWLERLTSQSTAALLHTARLHALTARPLVRACCLADVLHFKISKPEMHMLWRSIDIDSTGHIDFAEFVAMLFPHVPLVHV